MDANRKHIATAVNRGDVAQLFDALGWTTADVPVHGAAWRAWGWYGEPIAGHVVARTEGCTVLSVQGPARREMVTAIFRHAPLSTIFWVFVEADELVFAFASLNNEQRVFVRTMAIRRSHPDAMGFERVMRLAQGAIARPAELDPADAMAAHLAEVMDQEGLTRAFFVGFRDALDRLQETLGNGPENPSERREVSLVVLLRLVFLYFLQREDLLNGDRRYLIRQLRVTLVAGNSFYDDVLRPLFFGVLNTEKSARSGTALRLGEVPFLNGGLFDPTFIERGHPTLTWTNAVLTEVLEGLFERFHFTAVEPDGDDEARVVDPEMLGKVFEGLMRGDERRRSGAFYTPRDVVRRMVDCALDAHVRDRLAEGVTESEALAEVRILDPAVGTGAFLLEALASVRSRRRACGLAVDYAATRLLVHKHLFGVDRNPMAVRLCELRIWLVMLASLREEPGEVEPLPNLSHRIVAGDSLLDGMDLWRLRDGEAMSTEAMLALKEQEASLAEKQRLFLDSHGDRKAALRRELERLERSMQQTLIEARLKGLEQRLEPLLSVGASNDLFGESMATDEQRRLARDLQREIDTLTRARMAVATGREASAGFGYETRFGAVAREGFDIIATNPPWVRAQNIERPTRLHLRRRYRAASGSLWVGAEKLGIRTPFGSQPDLAALFVERSLELLRPGGRLAALIPAKLFRGLHGCALRGLLDAHKIESIEDLSEADRKLFDATVYPAVLHVKKAPRDDAPIDVTVWRRKRREVFRRDARHLTPSGRAGEPWVLVPDDVDAVLRRIRFGSTGLGNDPRLHVTRGVFTGANDVFIRPSGQFKTELGATVLPFVRPLLTGSGLGERPSTEILWCYDDRTVLGEVPAAVRGYFGRHEARLTARVDHDPRKPLWQLFRVPANATSAKVAWRDISVFLDPVELRGGAVALNTVYYVAFTDPDEGAGFARWMSSLPVRACAYALAERARGGWRRHFAWVVRMLPVPPLPHGWAGFDEREAFGLRNSERDTLSRWLELEREAA